jgi:uncharacterized protein (TIGR03435 family)
VKQGFVAGLLVAAVALGVARAQAPAAFEAASIKRNTTNGAGLPPVVVISGNRLSAPFVTLRELVRVAYGVSDHQVVGGPGWIGSDRFEVGATIPAGTSTDIVREMLRALLAERFHLATHTEKRDLPVYALLYTGQLGSKMRAAGPECAPLSRPAGLPTPPPPPPPPPGAGAMLVLGQPQSGSKCGTAMMRGFISARDIQMDTFAFLLMREVQRPVIDRTQLTGRYDLDLNFLPDSGPMMLNGTAINADAPSLTTAVREQLGLRLDSTREPFDVVVIDRVMAPTEN